MNDGQTTERQLDFFLEGRASVDAQTNIPADEGLRSLIEFGLAHCPADTTINDLKCRYSTSYVRAKDG